VALPADHDPNAGPSLHDRARELIEVLLSVPEDRREHAARLMCAGDADLLALVSTALSAAAQDVLLRRLRGDHATSSVAAAAGGFASTMAARQEEQPGATIGAYKLLERLGEGGFGEVYAAEQSEPIRRRVAIKIIKPGMDSRAVVARFEAERQALAMMDHPNIARVLDAGTTPAGRPFFVMELVRGVPITAYCEENRLSPRERIELMIPVCHAIQHAHQKGIIHRDIKPGNVLVTIIDSKAVPKVIDFGIAKAIAGASTLTDKTIYTAFRQFIGTPAYMSPEQILQSGVDVDTRSDVYALGVLVYELLSGSLPFDTGSLLKEGLERMQQVVREQDPPKPSTRVMTMDAGKRTSIAAARRLQPDKLGGTLRGEVDWMVMKAVERDRNRRYQSPSEFANDLERFLAGDAINAGPPSGVYRVRKFLRRYRATVAIAASAFAALLLLLASVAWGLRVARAEEQRTRTALLVAASEAEARRDAERLAQGRAAAANLTLAVEFLTGDRPDNANSPLASTPHDFRGWEWHHAATLAAGTGRACTDGSEHVLDRHARAIQALKAAGQQVPGSGGMGVLGTNAGELTGAAIGEGHLELYGALRGLWGVLYTPHADRVDALRISPDGGTIAVLFGRAIDLLPAPPLPDSTPRRITRQRLSGAPANIVDYGWTDDSNAIIARLDNGQVWRWDIDDAAGDMRLPHQFNTIFDTAQSPDGQRYFIGCWGMVRAIDARTFTPLWTSSFTRFYVERMVALSDDRILAIATADQPEFVLLDAHTGTVLRVWSNAPVTDLPVAVQPALLSGKVIAAQALRLPSGQAVLLATDDGSLHVLDTASWSLRPIPRPMPLGHVRRISALSVEPDGVIAVAETLTGPQGSSHRLALLDATLSSEQFIPFQAAVQALCWASSPRRLIAGDTSGTLHLLDLATNTVKWSTTPPGDSPIRAVAWLPSVHGGASPRVIAATNDSRLIWLDPADGEPRLTRRFARGVQQLLPSPDGSACFAAPIARLETTRDPTLTIARVQAQRTVAIFEMGPTADARHAAILQLPWPSPAHRDQAIAVSRGLGDDLAMRNSDALVALQREPASAIEARVLPITAMLTSTRPNSPSLALTHAWALVQSGRIDEAAATLNRRNSLATVQQSPPRPEVLALQARIAHRQGRTQEALELLTAARAAAGSNPTDESIRRLLDQAQQELRAP
jgi:serine/threonine protein kinase/outer membrane protein assembly factor BamB